MPRHLSRCPGGRDCCADRRQRCRQIDDAARDRRTAAAARRRDPLSRPGRDTAARARAYAPWYRGGAKVRGMIEDIFEMFPRLRERSGQNAGTLSGGEQQMLVLGRAMMCEPKLLCLDEPSLGLAPLVVRDIFRTIRTINESGTSVLLVEQNARYALETASRGYVLQTGSVMVSGTCAELARDTRVREAYLGRAAARAEAT